MPICWSRNTHPRWLMKMETHRPVRNCLRAAQVLRARRLTPSAWNPSSFEWVPLNHSKVVRFPPDQQADFPSSDIRIPIFAPTRAIYRSEPRSVNEYPVLSGMRSERRFRCSRSFLLKVQRGVCWPSSQPPMMWKGSTSHIKMWIRMSQLFNGLIYSTEVYHPRGSVLRP